MPLVLVAFGVGSVLGFTVSDGVSHLVKLILLIAAAWFAAKWSGVLP